MQRYDSRDMGKHRELYITQCTAKSRPGFLCDIKTSKVLKLLLASRSAWSVHWTHRCVRSVPGVPEVTWKLESNSRKKSWREGDTFLLTLLLRPSATLPNTQRTYQVPEGIHVLFYMYHQVESNAITLMLTRQTALLFLESIFTIASVQVV